jgi:hypothetical protein
MIEALSHFVRAFPKESQDTSANAPLPGPNAETVGAMNEGGEGRSEQYVGGQRTMTCRTPDPAQLV